MNTELIDLSNNLKSNFFEYFKATWSIYSDERLIVADYHEYLCNQAQELGGYILRRERPPHKWTVVNIPPGTSKSSIWSIAFPTWLLANDPSVFTINSSYSYELSAQFVRKSLKIIKSDFFKYLFGEIELTKETESYFETNQNGGRYATSTGGTITGVHGNLFIHDDPLSVQDSSSKAKRDSANRFIFEATVDRVRDKEITPFILVMQRLHEEDPTESILTKNIKLNHICLPAELSNMTTEGLEYLYNDGLLDPVRIGQVVIEEKKEELGSVSYAGQYEQNPIVKGGNKIKGEWFNYTTLKELPTTLKWDLWLDGAYTKQTANDPTGIMITAFLNNILYIRYAGSKHLEMPELLKWLQVLGVEHEIKANSRVFIEPKATGLTLQQLLRQSHFNPVLIESKLVGEGKEARIQTASPKVDAGKVTLIKNNWNSEFIYQLEGFPNCKNDEYVDLIGYAVDYYYKMNYSAPKTGNATYNPNVRF